LGYGGVSYTIRARLEQTVAKFRETCEKLACIKVKSLDNHCDTPQIAMVDSGSNLTLSGSKADFQSIHKTPNVRITAVDGDVDNGGFCGYSANFRPNNMGLRFGVFYPTLGVGQRIISGKKLTVLG
jgi:hypothetical protein